ncbi:MAG: DMT family transporter [Burkholderiaceae bacterium]
MSLPARPVFSLLANALIYGTCWWPFRHLDNAGLHALWATAIVYSLLTLVVLILDKGLISRLFHRPELIALALAAGLTNATFNWGLVIGDVVRVVLLFYLMPIWAALAGRWLLGESLGPAVIIRIICGLTGAALILYQPQSGFPLPRSPADWLGLAGGFWFAINNVLLRRQASEPPLSMAFAMFVGGMAIPGLLAIGLSIYGAVPWPSLITSWAPVTGLLAGGFALGNLMLIYGAARLPANVVSTILISEVLFAALSSYWIAGEALDALTIIGGLLIISASLAAALSARPEPAPAKL